MILRVTGIRSPGPLLLHEHLARGPGRISVAGDGSWLMELRFQVRKRSAESSGRWHASQQSLGGAEGGLSHRRQCQADGST